MNTISTINVPFHGSNLYVVNYNGEPYVPMKPIVEGMGLTWQSQFEKLKQRFSKGITEIVIPSKGGEQSMICLALRKLTGWLHTISPNKVKPEIRDKVIQYQEECDDVLYEYWTTGEVKAKKSTTTDDRAPLRNAVDCLMTKKRLSFPKAYGYVHAKYGVNSIDELPIELLPEAVDYIYKAALEGEYLPNENKPVTAGAFLTDEELLNLCYVWNDSTVMIRNMLDIEPLLQVAEHKLAGSFYEKPRDAMRKTNALRRTIERATQHIQIKRNEMSAWNILHRIRIPDMPW